MEEKTKENRIKEELTRITAFFEDVDANQKANIIPLLQNAAFMKVTLEDLQDIINKDGVTEVYQNGANQHGVKQSATLQSYNSLIKNYASVIKTLSALLPRVKKEIPLPDLARWTPREKTEEEIRKELELADARTKQINDEIARAIEIQSQRRLQKEEKEKSSWM